MAKRKDYPGYYRRRGDSWSWELRVRGQKFCGELQGDEEDVRRFLRQKRDELASHIDAGVDVGARFSTLLDQYERRELPKRQPRTQDSYRDTLKPVRRFFVDQLGDPRLRSVHMSQIDDYLFWRRTHGPNGEKRKPLHARTLNKDRAILHLLFTFARKRGLVALNPVSNLDPEKYDKREAVILTDEQFGALLAECEYDPMLWLWTLLLNETGLRSQSEALWLRWEDIDLAGGWVNVVSGRDEHRTKSGKSRRVPMTARLEKALDNHVAQYGRAEYDGARSPWVFHHLRTIRRAVAGHRITRLREEMNKAAKRAKLPADFRPHDLRHRRATTWIAGEANVHHVQKAMGHSTIQMTMEYTDIADEYLKALVRQPEDAPLH